MSHVKLKDRILSYQDNSNLKLLSKIPIIISINGRSFSKTTTLIDKPFCSKFAECMLSTTLKLCSEIDGSIFGYQHNDEILLILKNENPWYDNKVQKIASITSSIATLYFNTYAASKDINLSGDCIFSSQVFNAPNMQEAINTIIYKQQHNFYTSIQFACFYELLKKYDKATIKEMLIGLSTEEKIDLLNSECNINFDDYHSSFKRGNACYKLPRIIDGIVKPKWTVNTELPVFTKNQNFLNDILNS